MQGTTSMQAFTVRFSITEEDFLAAQRAHQRRNLFGRIQFGIGVVLFVFFLTMATLGIIFTPRTWVTYVVPLALAILYLYLFLFAHRIAYKRNPNFSNEIGVTVSDEGLFIVTPHSEATVGWQSYQRWVESPKMFLVYQQTNVFNLIPKRVLSEDQQNELREALSSRVGAKQICGETKR